MRNRIRQRGKNSWEIQVELPRDASGKRVRRFYSCKGNRKDAERKLTALLASIDKGDSVDKSRLTIAEHVADRIETWSTAKTISPKTRERYLEPRYHIVDLLPPVCPDRRSGGRRARRLHRAAHGQIEMMVAFIHGLTHAGKTGERRRRLRTALLS